ncbi:hypothetical protein [Microbacterium aquimaris]|uniref:Uncharacterized protein n=1 Tax=Microbacterium aquimaris TaxID=459816 RepID=A0ABU5N3Q7_9MICO|nr:hypothetical protein [Microbacterium aquimaris]MDZ8160730.1 hypothetical protein [Microbacterium aquimaris]
MREPVARSLTHAQRVLLVALGLGLLWAAAAILLHTPSAGAAEDDDAGLLGAATSVVEGATGAVDDVAGATLDTAATVVAPVVETVTEPVAKQAPAPVAAVVEAVPEVVAPVVETVTQTVTTTTDVVENGAGAVAETVETVVSSGPVSSVTTPVVELVSEVPIVGDVAEGLGVGEAITDTAAVIDTTVGTVLVGDTTDPAPPVVVIPELDLPVAPAVPALPGTVPALIAAHVSVGEAAIATAVASVATAMGAAWWSQNGSWAPSAIAAAIGATAVVGAAGSRLLTPHAAPSHAPGGNGSALGAAAAQPAGMLGDTWRSLLHAGPPHSHVDDALPGAPVYDTDSTPD